MEELERLIELNDKKLAEAKEVVEYYKTVRNYLLSVKTRLTRIDEATSGKLDHYEEDPEW